MKKKLTFFTSSTARLWAVLIMCVFGFNNAFGHGEHYVQAKAVVKKFDTGSGLVYVMHGKDTEENKAVINSLTDSDMSSTDITTDVYFCKKDGADDGSSDEHYFTYYAKPTAGKYFWGWYKDEGCAEVVDDKYSDHAALISKGAPSNDGTTKDKPELVTMYAKFSDEPYPYWWYSETLTATTKEPQVGVVGVAGGADAHYLEVNYGKKEDELLLSEKSINFPEKLFYANAHAARGYRFQQWNVGENVEVAEGYNNTNALCSFVMKEGAISEIDEENRSKTASGTVTAIFEEIPNPGVEVTIARNNASYVSVAATNHYYAIESEKLKYKSTDLDPMNEEELSKSYSLVKGDSLTLTATPAEGYIFSGWENGEGKIISYKSSYTIYVDANITLKALFSSEIEDPKFLVDSMPFADFASALEAANAVAETHPVIIPIEDYEIEAGDYTINEGVTLLVPKNSIGSPDKENADISSDSYINQSVFRTLTMASNANIVVNGSIEVAGTLCNAYAQGSKAAFPGNCCLTGTYGRIIMNESSSITLNNGSNLYAWGLISYDAEAHGSITVKNGANVYEPFQLTNFSGGSCLENWYKGRPSDTYDFIYSQYYVQNVEVPMTFEYGSTEIVQMAINPSSAQDVQLNFIGTSTNKAMFQLTSGAKVTKWYGKAKDRQMYSLTGNASINDLVISIYGMTLTTSAYRLPLNNNISVSILSGTTTINANAILFADAEVQVAKGAELVIPSGKSLWLYDKDEWGQTYDFITNYIAPLQYAWPNATYRTYSTMDDARLKVEGTVTINGSLFTTTGGAAITSSGTGTIKLPSGIITPSIDPTLHPMTKNGGRGGFNTHADIAVTPSKLRNSDAFKNTYGAGFEYLSTVGAPAGTEISYANGHWGWVEIWKDTDNNVLTALNTCAKVDDASVQSWAGIAIPAGKYGKWETEIDEAKQEVVHTAVIEDIASAETLDVLDEQSITINTDATVETTTIATTGKVSVPATATLTTTDLVLGATPEESSEIIIESNEVAAENVYFDLTRGAGKVFKHHTWYAFSVPFQVDASKILFDGQTMQYGQTSKKDDYDILYYDGSVRAAQGKAASCWKYVEKDDHTYLYPGTLYMIANTRRDVTTLRFTKVTGTDLLNTSVEVKSYTATTGNNGDANWNGIANPAVFHANMSGLGATEGIIWVYNPDAADPSNPYEEHDLTEDNIILGQAFFVQTPDPQTLVVSPSTGSAVPVARRRAQAKEANKTLDRFQVTIAPAGEKATDDVIIRMDENKEEDKYIIGTDLVRMGMSTMRPQLWVDRYDEKLCVNVIAPTNGQAEYPLGIFAPNDGEYQISVAQQPDNETTLYLTLDGKVIWNLNYNPYTATLTKGNTGRYGLLMVGNKAPEIATGVDEAVVDANGATRKVLINNHIYIVRGDQVYTINGQKIR